MTWAENKRHILDTLRDIKSDERELKRLIQDVKVALATLSERDSLNSKSFREKLVRLDIALEKKEMSLERNLTRLSKDTAIVTSDLRDLVVEFTRIKTKILIGSGIVSVLFSGGVALLFKLLV